MKQKEMIHEQGFSLIELLIVMVVFVILGSVLGSIIMTHIRSVEKTNSLTTVRQNGNYAIAQMSKDIRNASDIDTSAVNTVTLGFNTYKKRYQCDLNNKTIEVGTEITPGTYNFSSLFDTGSVKLTACSITTNCTGSTDTNCATDLVSISFTVEQVNPASLGRNVSVDFKTSVTRRN